MPGEFLVETLQTASRKTQFRVLRYLLEHKDGGSVALKKDSGPAGRITRHALKEIKSHVIGTDQKKAEYRLIQNLIRFLANKYSYRP
jgi:hypothetical protein